MLKIGITGNIGSGKTTICRVFEHLGVAVYYSDTRAKRFYNDVSVKRQIKNLFGENVFDAEQKVDTKKLARIVFQNENELQKLNNLMHPLVIDDFQKWCEERENQNIVLFESAIIYQCGLAHLFDKIILVEAPVDVLLQRSVQRDGVDMKSAKQRLENQQKNDNGRSFADFIIYNDGKHSLIQEVIRIYNLLNIKNKEIKC
jgi:dephospho-CoA kinase